MSKVDALELFIWLTREQCLESAIRSLKDQQVRGLAAWLEKRGDAGGVPVLIRGLLEVEACRRFMEGGNA